MKKALLLILISLLRLNSFAEQTELASATLSNDSLRTLVLKQLKLKLSDCKEDLFEEKVLPYSKTETVMVIPKLTWQDEEYENGYTVDAIIVVVNNQNGKITQRTEGENLLESDAVSITRFIIDTAPYMLSKDVRAFGIRVNYGNTSHVNPYYKTDIALYIQEGNKLHCVFGYYEISTENGERGSDECGARQRFISGTIAMDTESSNGYFNLILKEKASLVTTDSDEKGDCKETIEDSRERKTILYYNGKTYNFEIEW